MSPLPFSFLCLNITQVVRGHVPPGVPICAVWRSILASGGGSPFRGVLSRSGAAAGSGRVFSLRLPSLFLLLLLLLLSDMSAPQTALERMAGRFAPDGSTDRLLEITRAVCGLFLSFFPWVFPLALHVPS